MTEAAGEGWLYPRFLETSSLLPYGYAAPIGLLPCPALSIVIGPALMVNSLQSRAGALALDAAGLFYGITGVLQPGVEIDRVLLLGAVAILPAGFRKDQGGYLPAESPLREQHVLPGHLSC